MAPARCGWRGGDASATSVCLACGTGGDTLWRRAFACAPCAARPASPTPCRSRARRLRSAVTPFRCGTACYSARRTIATIWGEDVRAEDDDLNLRALAQGRPALAEKGAPRAALGSRIAARHVARPHAAGRRRSRLAAAMFVLSGFGGRGFTLAPAAGRSGGGRGAGRAEPVCRAPCSRWSIRRRFGEP